MRPWRGVSAEERQTRRREQLVEGCLNVLGADGLAAVTVDRVCGDAKLTKRYFYDQFSDLDALLAATADELVATLQERMNAALASTPDQSRRRHAIVSILIDVLAEDPRRARLYVESPGHPALRERRAQAIGAFTEYVAAALPEPQEPITAERRLLAIRLLVAGTTDLVASWLAGEIDADRASIIETIERLGEPV